MRTPSIAFVASMLVAAMANAIEAPKPKTSQPTAPAQPASVEVTPTDESAFFERLQYVTHWRNLRDLKVPDSVIASLAKGEVDVAVATLSAAAAKDSEEANIALVRIQHWCSRIGSMRAPNPQAILAELSQVLRPERLARAAGVLKAESEFVPRAAQQCRAAQFDYGAIEDRLRDSADLGRPASATELAQFTRDPKKRDALLEAAAGKQYAPALYAIASRRVADVQRGERTTDVASIRLYLKQAGRTLPKAKVDLANCMALGCDGHPADAASALAFGTDAARDGEPSAFLSMARMPWGRRLPRAQLLAWQYFGDRLNEAGCMGDAYIVHATSIAQALAAYEKGAPEAELQKAREQTDRLWQDNGPRAMREQGCAAEG